MSLRLWIVMALILAGQSTLKSQIYHQVWATDKVFNTPESVLYNANTNQVFVSNINGKPLVKDGNGFISVMDSTGKILSLKWVTGLDAPKGMAVFHDSLFVTDIDKIHIIRISQAKIVGTVAVKGAVFLNDIVVTTDGTAYISDTRKNVLYQLQDGKARVWSEDTLLENPNGLVLLGDDLLAVGVKNGVLKVQLKSSIVRSLMSDTGPVDGIIPLSNKKFIVSNWAGRILIASPTEKVVLYDKRDVDQQTADLGYISDNKMILIPTFFDNRVIAAMVLKK